MSSCDADAMGSSAMSSYAAGAMESGATSSCDVGAMESGMKPGNESDVSSDSATYSDFMSLGRMKFDSCSVESGVESMESWFKSSEQAR
jgi:hypothetical protein